MFVTLDDAAKQLNISTDQLNALREQASRMPALGSDALPPGVLPPIHSGDSSRKGLFGILKSSKIRSGLLCSSLPKPSSALCAENIV